MKRIINLIVASALFAAVCSPAFAQPAGIIEDEKPMPVRILYWNIQNGMWSDQGNNYDNFVAYVNSVNPDICVWAEGKSHYKTGSADRFESEDELYLTKHWPELAARYGHNYTYVGGDRDFYPQVITSRYPIENVKRITGTDSLLVVHGCGWATIDLNGRKFNFVTVHTWPQKYGFNIATEDRERSIAANEGDYFRRTEMEYICNETINGQPDAANEYWVMLGDFNSRSRIDNYHYKWPDDDTRFLVHDYIREHTPYIDIVAEKYPGEFRKTIIGGTRIDFVYMTKPAFKCLRNVDIIYDGYPANTRAEGLSNFCYPSDHYPIIIDLGVN